MHFHSPQKSRALGIEMIYQNSRSHRIWTSWQTSSSGASTRARSSPAWSAGWTKCGWSGKRAAAPSASDQYSVCSDQRGTYVRRTTAGGRNRPGSSVPGARRDHGRADGGPCGQGSRQGAGFHRAPARCGVLCILISHRLQDVFNVCDRVMVLRSGRTNLQSELSKRRRWMRS